MDDVTRAAPSRHEGRIRRTGGSAQSELLFCSCFACFAHKLHVYFFKFIDKNQTTILYLKRNNRLIEHDQHCNKNPFHDSEPKGIRYVFPSQKLQNSCPSFFARSTYIARVLKYIKEQSESKVENGDITEIYSHYLSLCA